MRNITGKQEQSLSKNLKGTWEEHVSERTVFEIAHFLHGMRSINSLAVALLELFPSFFSHFRSIRQDGSDERRNMR
jgi:hypothetical protein